MRAHDHGGVYVVIGAVVLVKLFQLTYVVVEPISLLCHSLLVEQKGFDDLESLSQVHS